MDALVSRSMFAAVSTHGGRAGHGEQEDREVMTDNRSTIGPTSRQGLSRSFPICSSRVSRRARPSETQNLTKCEIYGNLWFWE